MNRRLLRGKGLRVAFAVCGLVLAAGCREPNRDAETTPRDAVSSSQVLCEQWLRLKDAGDPSAKQLLAALPVVPVEAISTEEAERFQADCFLHQDIRILSIRATRSNSNRFVLATKGNVSAPTLQINTIKGIDRVQRTMVNPDLLVEVRDGKIHGVRAEMHAER